MREEIKKELKELADEKYKDFSSNLCPGINNILGIRVPILRNYAKELSKKYDINKLLQEIDDEYHEEIMLQGMLIGLDKTKDINVVIRNIRKFVPKIDNWAVCDVFVAGLKIVDKNKEEFWSLIQEYLKSDKEFEVRFAIVMILGYYVDEKHIYENLKIFDNVKLEKYYVQMAVAWAISLCFIKFYDITLEYIKNNKLDKFTHNKAIQKTIESYRITEEQKNELRILKK